MNFSELHIKKAAEVSQYLMSLSKDYPDRWERVVKKTGVGFPFGDLAYGAAIVEWENKGKRPSDTTFSYHEGSVEDPFLIEFSDELTEKFGMRILTIEEGKARMREVSETTKVHDWGLN